MILSITVVFKGGLAKIDTTKEAANARDGMIVFILLPGISKNKVVHHCLDWL